MKKFVLLVFCYTVFSFSYPFGLKAQPKDIVRLKWVNFGPYTLLGQNPGSGNALTDAQIISLLDSLKPWVEGIRTFGVDNVLKRIPYLAKQRGFKVIVGIWLSNDTARNSGQIANGISIAKDGCADKLIVGSEVLLRNELPAAKIIDYINIVKQACPNIPVSYSDTYSELLAHPEVLGACDYVSPNIYPFWDGFPIECAMQGFHQSYLSILNIAAGKEILVTETGWKTIGPKSGEAVPSLSNAIRFTRELLNWSKAFGVEVNIFAAFDEPWKEANNDGGWGLFNSNATLKTGMDSIFAPIVSIDSTWQCHRLDNGSADTINFDFVPPIGSSYDLKGHINFLKPCDYRIATYIKVNGNWWPKPFYTQLTVPVLCNGDFTVDVTTGGRDTEATEIELFLVPENNQNIANAVSKKLIKKCPLPYNPININPANICKGNSSVLTATGGTSYLWDNGDTAQSVQVSPETTTEYFAMVTNSSGCVETRSAKVIVQTEASYNYENITICDGDSYMGHASSGTFTRNLKSISGCDSIITTTLTMHHSIGDKAPVIQEAIVYGQTALSIAWSAPDVDPNILGYRFDVATDSLFTEFASIDGLYYEDFEWGKSNILYINGLKSNTAYFFRVHAYNVCGLSSYSRTISVVTLPDPPLPPLPSPASNILQTSFTANWGNSATASGYRIDVASDSLFNVFVPGYKDFDVGNVLSYNVTGLYIRSNYYYRIRAYNSGGIADNSSTVLITTLSNPPVANAGPDGTVDELSVATLDGTASSDPDNDVLTYLWAAPDGITLNNVAVAKPTFIAPKVYADKTLTFSLTVNDGMATSATDQVVITVRQLNKLPVANAGSDQSVNEGVVVTLDGSASSDVNGKTANQMLTFLWSAPKGVRLNAATVAKPTFSAPQVTKDTAYTFTLTVREGLLSSVADQVVVTVKQVNKTPIANAGIDRSMNELTSASLDGSASSDPDNDVLSYLWVAPADVILSNVAVAKPTFVAPEVYADKTLTFSLTVNDGTASSATDQVAVTVKQVNKPPIASAGPDQSVIEGALTTLDGSLSSDPDNDLLIKNGKTAKQLLAFLWSAPKGVRLNSATIAKPTFTAPQVTKDTAYTFTLTVRDGLLSSVADQVVVTVKQVNKTPIANAGIDRSMNELTSATLDGSASTDPDNDVLSYLWVAPADVILSNVAVAKPTFVAPEVYAYKTLTFSLTVNDGTASSATDRVVVTVKQVNKPPVANAGSDQSVIEGALVTLDGSASSDPDNDLLIKNGKTANQMLAFLWSAPKGVKLNSATVAKPTFTAPQVTKDTAYTFTLTVRDGLLSSVADQVVVTVKQASSPLVLKVGVLNDPVGIEQVVSDQTMTVYPNPTNGSLYLKFKDLPEANAYITVYNSLGKMIFKTLADKKEMFLNLGGNAPGLYLIKIDLSIPKTYKVFLQ